MATNTNIVTRLNCAHRRFGVVIESSLAIGLAMSTSIPRRPVEGKREPVRSLAAGLGEEGGACQAPLSVAVTASSPLSRRPPVRI